MNVAYLNIAIFTSIPENELTEFIKFGIKIAEQMATHYR
jgi:hypothetical protein